MLRNRWIVRQVSKWDLAAPVGAVYCVECRATCAIVLYGSLRDCRARRRALNTGR